MSARVSARAPRLVDGATKRPAAKPCLFCKTMTPVAALTRHGRCEGCVGLRFNDGVVDQRTRYADDRVAQHIVVTHRGDMTLELIGQLMGLTRERVRQIEAEALRSMAMRLRVAGVSQQDVVDMLVGKAAREQGMSFTSRAEAEVTSVGRPRDDRPLPVEGYSEHAARVEAALAEMEERVAKVERLVEVVGEEDASEEERAA